MMAEAQIRIYDQVSAPDPWDEDWSICLPLDHIICRDLDGTPHTVGEYIWPWTAYTPDKKRVTLHFYYWRQGKARLTNKSTDLTGDRVARVRELQFLMTRIIYLGRSRTADSLKRSLSALFCVARFAEAHSYSVRHVLETVHLLDACLNDLSDKTLVYLLRVLAFFRQLDPTSQIGFIVALPTRIRTFAKRVQDRADRFQQVPPLPTRIFCELINNLDSELSRIEAHQSQLVSALNEAMVIYRARKQSGKKKRHIGPDLIEKHKLGPFLDALGIKGRGITSLARAVTEIFKVCKLQVHVFSGMRESEARDLPFDCMVISKDMRGLVHCLIAGATTKFNNGRRLKTQWVTTEAGGFRAIRLAQRFAAVIYSNLVRRPGTSPDDRDEFPLFPATSYLPWLGTRSTNDSFIVSFNSQLVFSDASTLTRICPKIEECDIAELEEIDPLRAWRDEKKFSVGGVWPLASHQIRRSLAMYANRSGFVKLSTLRRQLQHITSEMTLYYANGSAFCRNFIEDDVAEFNMHLAPEWQDGMQQAQVLAFKRDVLNSSEPMFGGAGAFYSRQRARCEVMSSDEVARQIKSGLLGYRDGPLGGCTRPGECESVKGLNLINSACATSGCKHFVGKHSVLTNTIGLMRASMLHVTPGSITQAFEEEELRVLEQLERDWRPDSEDCLHSGDDHGK